MSEKSYFLIQALVVLAMVVFEDGLCYLLLRKCCKAARGEAALMATGLTLLLCVAAWLCKWGNEIRWEGRTDKIFLLPQEFKRIAHRRRLALLTSDTQVTGERQQP
jgi:hypothetical protein